MERHDFDTFGQVVAVAIEQGIRAGLEAAKDERAAHIEQTAKQALQAYRSGHSHNTLAFAMLDLAKALETCLAPAKDERAERIEVAAKLLAVSICDIEGRPIERDIVLNPQERAALTTIWLLTRESK